MRPLDRRDFLAAAPFALAASPRARDDVSPFLQGNFAPVREEATAADLRVVGRLPAGLEGMFVRNGPNPRFDPKGAYHWFDGDGMLHGLRVRDGRATYRSRYVRTEGWLEEDKAKKALYSGMAAPPDLARLAKGKEGYKNAANTALVWYDGKLLALWEGGAPHEVRVPDLTTAGRYTFGGKLKHSCTAHPKIDPANGEMHFFGYQPVRPYLQYAVADAKGVITKSMAVEIPRPVMMHDFALTARHAVFMDLPVTFSFARLMGGMVPFAWEPKRPARFGVLPRDGTAKDVKWFPSEPCYVFHVLNAYDEGDEVVLLACRMGEFPAEIVPPDRMTERDLRRYGARLHRWRFDLKAGTTKEEPVGDEFADFPRFNEALAGRKTRYGYLTTLRMDALVKYDLQRGRTLRHEFGRGRFGGEAVFAPRPGGKGEDDGWLLSYVYDAAGGKSEAVVLDARDLSLAARVLLPGRVPYGFHGAWVPASAF